MPISSARIPFGPEYSGKSIEAPFRRSLPSGLLIAFSSFSGSTQLGTRLRLKRMLPSPSSGSPPKLRRRQLEVFDADLDHDGVVRLHLAVARRDDRDRRFAGFAPVAAFALFGVFAAPEYDRQRDRRARSATSAASVAFLSRMRREHYA